MDEIENLKMLDFKTLPELKKLEEMLSDGELYKNKEWVEFFQNALTLKKNYHQNFYLIGYYFLKKIGKIKISSDYFEKYLSLLLLMKRIPELKKIAAELSETNHFKKRIIENILFLENKMEDRSLETSLNFSSFRMENGLNPIGKLQSKIEENNLWNKEKVMLIYEYVLRFGADEFIVNQIDFKINNYEEYKLNYLNLKKKYLHTKDIRPQSFEVYINDIALNYFHEKESDDEVEDRVNSYLNFESYENLKAKGKEMLLAFKMMGMSRVVHGLADKLLAFDISEKEKIEVAYIKSNEYLEASNLLDLIDFVENVVVDLELTSRELAEFYFLIFNLSKRLGRKNVTNVYSEKISRLNTGSEVVARRIKLFEKN